MSTPPPIDRALLQKLADLARLHVPQDRQATLLGRLQRIVSAFESLRELPAGDVPPSTTAGPASMVLRPDVVEPPMALDQVLANAKASAAGAFVVPRVVDA